MRFIDTFETATNKILLVFLATVVALATLDLGWFIVKDVVSPPLFLLDADELLDLFGRFLLVLIGIELLGTIKLFLRGESIHVEVILTVSLIAIARKVIILEPKELDGISLIGTAAIILALGLSYFLVARTAGRLQKSRSDVVP